MWWKTKFMILSGVIHCSLMDRHKRIDEGFSARVQSQCSKYGDKISWETLAGLLLTRLPGITSRAPVLLIYLLPKHQILYKGGRRKEYRVGKSNRGPKILGKNQEKAKLEQFVDILIKCSPNRSQKVYFYANISFLNWSESVKNAYNLCNWYILVKSITHTATLHERWIFYNSESSVIKSRGQNILLQTFEIRQCERVHGTPLQHQIQYLSSRMPLPFTVKSNCALLHV